MLVPTPEKLEHQGIADMEDSDKLANGQIRVNGSRNNKRNYVTASLGKPQIDQQHHQDRYVNHNKRVRFRTKIEEIKVKTE